MDKECSMVVKKFTKQQMNTKIQFVEANNHRVNAAERAICIFKSHFIAGLCTVEKISPLQLWFDLLQQAEITLHILWITRINTKLSAYAVLEGQLNFNKTPLTTPGTKALVYIDHTVISSCGTHAVDAWYTGPAMERYRCFKFWIPKTQG